MNCEKCFLITYDFSVLLVALRATKSAASRSPKMHYVHGLYDTIITLYRFVWSLRVNKHYREGYWVFGLVHHPLILSVGHHRHDTLVDIAPSRHIGVLTFLVSIVLLQTRVGIPNHDQITATSVVTELQVTAFKFAIMLLFVLMPNAVELSDQLSTLLPKWRTMRELLWVGLWNSGAEVPLHKAADSHCTVQIIRPMLLCLPTIADMA